MLTSENLRGIWAGVPTPWDDEGRLDVETLSENVDRLCGVGVHGVYTTGTSGEVYAVSDAEFPRLVKAFVQGVEDTGVPVQIGISAPDTRGCIRRAEIAVEHGVDAVQAALPYWMPLNESEIVQFFVDLSKAAPGAPIVHYNTTKGKNRLTSAHYRRIMDATPSLIGTKQETNDMEEILEICFGAPGLAHFGNDWVLVPSILLGLKGSYSVLINVNPRLILDWYSMCERGEWGPAMEIQTKIYRLIVEVDLPLAELGYSWASGDKAWVSLSNFLKGSRTVRPPYQTVPDDVFENVLRKGVLRHMPELIV